MSKASGILAIAAFALVGCVTSEEGAPDPYGMRHGNGGMGTLCVAWVHRQGSGVDTDSTATCKDGSKPALYYAQWFSDNSACTVNKAEDVKGGLAGIRRVFGCAK